MTVLTKTVAGMDFKDVSAELRRTYTFVDDEGNEKKIDVSAPLWLNVSASGGHRIIVADNSTVYIPAGWLKLQWWNKPGFEPLQF
jgi:hypothetical protein